jgi:hypothetical protein
MNTTEINVGVGHLSFGQHSTGIAVCGAGYAGQAWRARPTTGAKSVLGGPVMTDAPVDKPKLVSASERCP